MTKMAVVGSRDRLDKTFIDRALDQFHAKHGVTLLVSGGAQGVDTIGAHWAGRTGIRTLIHFADWGRYGRPAGHIRNEYIVRDADVVLAFVTDWRTSKGTRNTVGVHVKAQNKPCFMHDATTGAWTQNAAATAWLAARP